MAYDPFPAGGQEAYCPRCGQMVVTYEPGQGCVCFRDDDDFEDYQDDFEDFDEDEDEDGGAEWYDPTTLIV